jgi:hypothetical protein
MISHDYKCILVHIPRTGGTSFEQAVFGGNWWAKHKETKHILASQAKKIYQEYWDDYFKFAVVRNPWDRCVSMMHFGNFFYGAYGDTLTESMLDWYKEKFGYPVVTEFDYRFYKREEILHSGHCENQVYGNIIDEDLDYIAKLETIDDDFAEISKILGLNKKQLPKAAKSTSRKKEYHSYYTDQVKEIVEQMYLHDIVQYEYTF